MRPSSRFSNMLPGISQIPKRRASSWNSEMASLGKGWANWSSGPYGASSEKSAICVHGKRAIRISIRWRIASTLEFNAETCIWMPAIAKGVIGFVCSLFHFAYVVCRVVGADRRLRRQHRFLIRGRRAYAASAVASGVLRARPRCIMITSPRTISAGMNIQYFDGCAAGTLTFSTF